MLTVDQCVQQLRNNYEIVCQVDCNYSNIEIARVDLYTKLRAAHKEAYLENQRLIFVLEQDLYNTNSSIGSVLQAIQVILQDIDISNYFICLVTTNSDIDSEYQYIKHNISSDSVNFHVYQCQGNFTKINVEHTVIQGKIQSLTSVNLASLTDKQQHLLFVDPVFCMIPWVGINVDTTSKVYPCCHTQHKSEIGNTTTHSIEQIWNSDKMNSIRRAMITGKSVKSCQSCYEKEKLKQPSPRINFNKEFANNIQLINSTRSDGSLPTTNIKYWDIRYNNLCNFACRSCNPKASSSWFKVHNTIHPDKKLTIPLLTAGNDQDAVFDQMRKNINHVDTIYFAGGEPAMIENFYKILELLIEHNRTDVKLRYNINMSRLTLKDKSLLTLWSHFKYVTIGASLDAEQEKASYLRVGTVWDDIVTNRIAISNHCPHVDFWISATTGLINALHVPDFHQSWVAQGLIKPDNFNIQMLLAPDYQSIINAPDQLKQKIIDRYQQHLEWLTPLDKTGRAVHGFNSVVEMCRQQGHYNSEKFWTEVNNLDQYHGTSLLETFPELRDSGL